MTKSIAIKSAFSCGGKAWDYLEQKCRTDQG